MLVAVRSEAKVLRSVSPTTLNHSSSRPSVERIDNRGTLRHAPLTTCLCSAILILPHDSRIPKKQPSSCNSPSSTECRTRNSRLLPLRSRRTFSQGKDLVRPPALEVGGHGWRLCRTSA